MDVIEFNRWYNPGASLSRCLRCYALVAINDTEEHAAWHETLGG